MALHPTKGIVLRSTKYGDTSIIVSVYTSLFGLQSYIIKGVRQDSKKKQGRANYFQPASLLDMVVYHNESRALHFVKEYSWNFFYQNIFFDVVKNCVSLYIIELLQHTIKQPEPNAELFNYIETTLHNLDSGSNKLVANMPIFFTLQLAGLLGFQIQGNYSLATPYLDFLEGKFVSHQPNHPNFIDSDLAAKTELLLHANNVHELEKIACNQLIRQSLLHAYQQFLSLHITDFGTTKTLSILHNLLK